MTQRPRVSFVALAVQAHALLACVSTARALRPLHAVNVTVYHVGEANFSGLVDMNSGNAAGDAEFMVRAAGLKYLCSPGSGQANYTFDCYDEEQDGDDLVVSKLVLEVDDRFSEYAECNVDPSTQKYSCECYDRGPNASHSYPPDTVPCAATMGKIAVVNESSWGRVKPDPKDPEPWEQSSYRYYYYNAAQKLGGEWYSTLRIGNCDRPGISQSNCTWRVVTRERRISKRCQENILFSVVEDESPSCFNACPDSGIGPKRNTSSGCWTVCIYDTIFGPNSNHTAYPGGTTRGMSRQVLVDAWTSAFTRCPNV